MSPCLACSQYVAILHVHETKCDADLRPALLTDVLNSVARSHVGEREACAGVLGQNRDRNQHEQSTMEDKEGPATLASISVELLVLVSITVLAEDTGNAPKNHPTLDFTLSSPSACSVPLEHPSSKY